MSDHAELEAITYWRKRAEKAERERDQLRETVRAKDKALTHALGGFATDEDGKLLAIFNRRYREMWERFYPPGGR